MDRRLFGFTYSENPGPGYKEKDRCALAWDSSFRMFVDIIETRCSRTSRRVNIKCYIKNELTLICKRRCLLQFRKTRSLGSRYIKVAPWFQSLSRNTYAWSQHASQSRFELQCNVNCSAMCCGQVTIFRTAVCTHIPMIAHAHHCFMPVA